MVAIVMGIGGAILSGSFLLLAIVDRRQALVESRLASCQATIRPRKRLLHSPAP